MSTLREAAQQALEALEKYRQMMFAEAGCRWGAGDSAITTLRAALAQEQAEPTCKQSLQVDHGLNMNTPQAAQRLLDALAAALPHAPLCAEFDRVADAADDLRAALKRREKVPTQETDMTTLREAAQQALEALAAYRREMGDRQPCDAEIALQAALKREEEALAWLEERKRHWRRERERMRSPQ